MRNLLSVLNEPQRSAVTTTQGPLLILAGPGSGKTRVITYRIVYLVQQAKISPWQIIAVTFTNKAAKEMRTRLEQLLTPAQAKSLTIGTFHAICARVLRREPDYLSRYGLTSKYTIFDQADQAHLIKQALSRVDISDLSFESPPKIAEIQDIISRTKAHMRSHEQLAETAIKASERLAARVMPVYHQLLRLNNGVDFDDLLLLVEHLWRSEPERLRSYQERWQHVSVDEFQDCNLPQYKLIRLLGYGTAERHESMGNVCVVGDDDQMIYSWRGASTENILRFEQDFPQTKVVFLEQNYRSTQIILDAAQHLVQEMTDRKPKRIWTERVGGQLIQAQTLFDDRDEARFVAQELRRLKDQQILSHWKDAAVLYRMNAQSRSLEEQLRRYRIPYLVIGSHSFYDRREVKDMLAYLRLLANPHDDLALLRIINVPSRKIGAQTIKKMQDWATHQHCSLYQAVMHIGDCPGLKANARQAIAQFGRLMTDLLAARDRLALPELFDQILDQTNYRAELEVKDSEDIDRKANVEELRRVACEFTEEEPTATLEDFLEQTSLLGGADIAQEGQDGKLATEDQDAVRLMTLHAAKGLEFAVVSIIGMNEGCLPHSRAWSLEELAEERRLAYVGFTRAKDRLYLLSAARRYVQGEVREGCTSRFLDDLPAHLVVTT